MATSPDIARSMIPSSRTVPASGRQRRPAMARIGFWRRSAGFAGVLAGGLAPTMVAQPTGTPVPDSPPVAQALPRPAIPGLQTTPQQAYGPSGDTLIARQAVDGVLENFRRVYTSDGAPRVVIYVNRALVDAFPTLGHPVPNNPSATTEAAAAAEIGNAVPRDGTPSLALADQRAVREVERLFGRVFRHAGAQLADPGAAALLLPEKPGTHLIGEPAAPDRAALAAIADIAIEVLISSRNLVVPEIQGDVTYAVPDIQATAIRLKDSIIVGQAAASDLLGRGVQAGRIIRQFDSDDITEATAIALMEDMLTGSK